MTYSLRFLPDVEDDVLAAYRWYEQKASGLGEEFLRVFYAVSTALPRNPLIDAKVWGEFRRRLLRRFPYALYFRILGQEVVVFGLFHCARDPGALRAQLLERDDPLSPE